MTPANPPCFRCQVFPRPPRPVRRPARQRRRLRRVLRRARDGATLNVDEAANAAAGAGNRSDRSVFLGSQGSRCGSAGSGSAEHRDVFAEGFHSLTRLCQDKCHYCTFVTVPGKLRAAGHGMFLEPDEVLDIARAGAELGCKEALFTLGDRPEARWPEAKQWLDERGYDSTLDYVRAMSIRVLEETGLLPHLNPGVMSWQELSRLKPVAPSMGMMLETTATRLFTDKGECHYGSPDKDPAVRLRTLTDAGRLNIPFTTGILVGIGENFLERAESIMAIRKSQKAFGHIQEVIIQNFLAKPDTAMRDTPDAGLDEFLAAIAVARLLLGPTMRIQSPPNLVSNSECLALLGAGVDDWGGVSPLTPDHVNPERPWPNLETLAEISAEGGFTLTERTAAQPAYVLAGLRGSIRALRATCRHWRTPKPASPGPTPTGGSTVAGTGRVVGIERTRRSQYRDRHGRGATPRPAVTWAVRSATGRPCANRYSSSVLRFASTPICWLRCAVPNATTAGCSDDEYLALATAEGPGLEAVVALADALRKDAVGEDVTYVVNRNINFTNICYTGLPVLCICAAQGRRRRLHAVGRAGRDRAWEAHVAGRDRGVHAGRYRSGTSRHRLRRPGPGRQEARAVDARPRVLADGDRQRCIAQR